MIIERSRVNIYVCPGAHDNLKRPSSMSSFGSCSIPRCFRSSSTSFQIYLLWLLAEVFSDSAERAERVLRRAVEVEVLVLDDFAFRKVDQREAEMLYVLAEERLGRASTVLTSNRAPEDWYAMFPDPVVSGALLHRMVSSAIKLITTTGKSY